MKVVRMSEVIFTKEIIRPLHHCQFYYKVLNILKYVFISNGFIEENLEI